MQGTSQPFQHAWQGQARPQGGGEQDVNERDHAQHAFALLPSVMRAKLLTDEVVRVHLFQDMQTDLLTHLVIQVQMA